MRAYQSRRRSRKDHHQLVHLSWGDYWSVRLGIDKRRSLDFFSSHKLLDDFFCFQRGGQCSVSFSSSMTICMFIT